MDEQDRYAREAQSHGYIDVVKIESGWIVGWIGTHGHTTELGAGKLIGLFRR